MTRSWKNASTTQPFPNWMDGLLSTSRNAVILKGTRRMGEATVTNNSLERMEESENETAKACLAWCGERKSMGMGKHAESLLVNCEKSNLT